MKVSMNGINQTSFSSKNQTTNNSKNKKNHAKFLLAYATMFAVFPHDFDKYVDKVDINFKQLPLKDKAKNVVKVALPTFGYPLLALLGLKVGVDLINKYEKSKEKTKDN